MDRQWEANKSNMLAITDSTESNERGCRHGVGIGLPEPGCGNRAFKRFEDKPAYRDYRR